MKKLILFDHDGTVCKSNENSYDSMIYAAEQAANNIGINIKKLDIEWSKAFSETEGTTEKNLVHYLIYLLHIPIQKFSEFERLYYLARESWYKNMKAYKEFVYDLYYPDAEILIDYLKPKPDYILRIVTGNPSNVLKERIANYMKNAFSDKKGNLKGFFGESAYTRTDLLNSAMTDTQKEVDGFDLEQDKNGFYKNVYYVADSKGDFFAGLKSKIKMVWIPSRSIQNIQDLKSDEAIGFLLELYSKYITITNNLENKEVLEFIES